MTNHSEHRLRHRGKAGFEKKVSCVGTQAARRKSDAQQKPLHAYIKKTIKFHLRNS
jgi:hypothetical protein